MKIIIAGRTASGKTHLANLLEQNGLPRLRTRTTRPMRPGEEGAYHFMTTEEAAAVDDKFLKTGIGEFEYFTTKAAIAANSVMILDPSGVHEVLATFPDELFILVYVVATDETLRRNNAVARGDDEKEEAARFWRRCETEDEAFTAFEAWLHGAVSQDVDGSSGDMPENLHAVVEIYNDYNADTLQHQAARLVSELRALRNLIEITSQCKDLDILDCDAEGRVKVVKTDLSVSWYTPEHFAALLLRDKDGLAMLMGAWLRHEISFSLPGELTPVEETDGQEGGATPC